MDVIGGLLRSSLLVELGDDEDRVEHVRSAARDLATELAGPSRSLVPYAIIAAVDESASPTATPLLAAERVLLGRWETFHNAFPEQPTEILRAVTLTAVALAAELEETLLQAAWYALRNAIDRLPVGRWEQPVSDLMSAWESSTRESLGGAWSPSPASGKLRMPTVAKVDQKRITINTSLRDRAQELQNASNYNMFSQQLQGEFAAHIEQIISVSEILAAEAHKLSVAQLKEFATGLGARLRDALAAHEQTIESIRLRNELLWWRQTAFSGRLSRPYAGLSAADVVIAAAMDLHDLVPSFAPRAVEHLLADLVNEVAGEDTVGITISELAAAEQARALPASSDMEPAMIIDGVRGGKKTQMLDADQSLTASRLTVLIFRDLQARRLASLSPPMRPSEAE